MRNARLDVTSWNQDRQEKYQYNVRYVDHNTLMEESEEELKSLLMRVKEKSEKAGLKFNIPKTKIMASGPITARNRRGKVGSSDRFPLLGL